MNFLRRSLVVSFSAFALSAFSQDFMDMSLEELMDVQVVTASKTVETLEDTSSVITVITREDIERSGYRTIYELLQRVPGFFPSTQATWLMTGSRGFVSHGNDNILLLVDGHPQNSIVAHGYQQQNTVPTLDKVERIEIIRGPGSVLWGTSAAYGIISVLTKDRIKDGSQVNISYGDGDHLKTINYLQDIGEEGDHVKGIFSATIWDSDGWNEKGEPNVKFPWGADKNYWPNLNDQSPGYELYSKVSFGEKTQLIARLTETSVVYPWDTWGYDGEDQARPGSELRMRKAYVRLQKKHRSSDSLTWIYSMYGDMMLQNRTPFEPNKDAEDTRWIEDQTREENAIGFEVEGQKKLKNHFMKFGAKFVTTKVGPNRGFRYDVGTNLPTDPAPGEDQIPYIDIPSGYDNSLGLYFEDRYTFNGGKSQWFGGLRADGNDWRQHSIVLLPRTGFIQKLGGDWTGKYIYNTGYLRPNAAYSKVEGKFFRSASNTIEDVKAVTESQQVQSHDAQLIYRTDNTYFAATAFYMEIANFISWETKLDMGYYNMGDASSYGVELEWKHRVGKWAFNSNYSFAKATLHNIPTGVDHNGNPASLEGALTNDDKEWLNYPRHIINFGFDYLFTSEKALNLNIRSWHDMPYVKSFDDNDAGEYGTLAGEQYLDVAYRDSNLWNGGSMTVYVHNILDNSNEVGMAINNGTFHPMGRNIGLKLSQSF